MELFNIKFHPPSGFTKDQFCLFFTDDSFYEEDYKAVMDSKEILRIWSQSSWPEDSFTPQENKEDLKHHIEDNQTHSAYGYMIFSADKKKCLGSVYVNPLQPVADNYSMTDNEKAALTKFDARIDYWTIAGMEKEVFLELHNWFLEEWRINPLFAARKGMQERLEVYDSLKVGLKYDLKSKTSDMSLLLYLPLSNK